MKKFSILIVGSVAKGAIENEFAKGFANLGQTVYRFDMAGDNVSSYGLVVKVISRIKRPVSLYHKNNELIKFASNLLPDVILIFKGMNVYPGTVSNLKNVTKLLCNYNPDHPFLYFSKGSGNSFVKNSIQYYDLHISYSRQITSKLKSRFNKDAYWVPFGYDDSIAVPSKLPDIKDHFVFIGAWDKERETFFNKLPGIPLKIFGSAAWMNCKVNSQSYNYYQKRSVIEKEYYETSFSALGCLNLMREQNLVEDSHNMRSFEVPGVGGLLISQRTQEQLGFFEEDKEAIYFSDENELMDKLKDIRKGIIDTDRIKKNALERSIRSNYSYQCRSREIIDIFSLYI